MLRYNLKQSWRSLTTNKFLTFLILTSFSVGLAACMVLALYIHREYTVDQCYPNHEHIYRLIDTTRNNANMDYEIAEKMKSSFPEVELATPVIYWNMQGNFVRSITDNHSVIIEQVINTSNDFFPMFSVKTIIGNAQSPFTEETSMVITRSLAVKLFGTTDVLGKQLDLAGYVFGEVSAVVEDLPDNSSLGAEVFVNCMGEKATKMAQTCIDNVCHYPMSIYVKLSDKSNCATSLAVFNKNFPVNKSKTQQVTLQALKNVYLATNITGSENKSGSATMMSIYLAIAIVILFLSVFNYVNFTLSKQLSMLRQLGVRRVNGAGIAQLRMLCITEVIITIGLATLTAVGITALALPMASSLLATSLSIETLFSPLLMIISASVLLLLLVVSGFAPLYIVTTFDIESLFGKKNFRMGKQKIKRSLTIIQMLASIVLLVSLFTIYLQLSYVQKFNLGFNKDHLVRLHTNAYASWAALKQQVDQCSFVDISSVSNGVPGNIFFTTPIKAKDDKGEDLKIIVKCFSADEFFLSTLGIPLQTGSDFNMANKGKACYLNEEAFQQTGWANIEGKRLDNIVEGGLDIVGVTANFNIESLHKTVHPVCLVYLDVEKDRANNLSIRLRPGNVADQLKELERIWKKTIPEAPFQYTFYDEAFDAFYRKEQQQAKAISIFSIIALIITCMGLLGQVFQTCLARVKEIGIRKINGAHASEIILLLNRDLLKWMAVAFVVAVPLSYFIMNKWLENFAYKIALSWWIFVLAGLATLSLATITVSWLTWHAANNNPAEAIKSE